MATELAMPKKPGEPQVKGPEMNDRDRINDILSTEKYLSTAYGIGLNEMQNPQLHQAIQQILNDVHTSQFQLFELMFQNGWYKMKVADAQEVAQTKQQFSNYRTQFPTFH